MESSLNYLPIWLYLIIAFLVLLVTGIVFLAKAASEIFEKKEHYKYMFEKFQKHWFKILLIMIGIMSFLFLLSFGLSEREQKNQGLRTIAANEKEKKKLEYTADSLTNIIRYRDTIEGLRSVHINDTQVIGNLRNQLITDVNNAIVQTENKGQEAQKNAVADAIANITNPNSEFVQNLTLAQKQSIGVMARQIEDSITKIHRLEPSIVQKVETNFWNVNHQQRMNEAGGKHKDRKAKGAKDIIDISVFFLLDRLPQKKDIFLVTVLNNNVQIASKRAEFEYKNLSNSTNTFPVAKKSIKAGKISVIITNGNDTLRTHETIVND